MHPNGSRNFPERGSLAALGRQTKTLFLVDARWRIYPLPLTAPLLNIHLTHVYYGLACPPIGAVPPARHRLGER
uniref:Uncharacterized protein n=1 Tax=Candidatus Kentrum sp. MB TaxID=2138164 RepID=A0A451B8T9_9GAMM|nr:MAG: hypothetical protein BECKMB1821G_GA0114241_101312 [Candidatus Kentron sp. MB]VFK29170.1 MAG: hypothetical protein BECKMB1821I_GA0114274_100864 [Candidatus Kentron sp. MB]VFK74704.1 MAG: hypothetical protein BECKMB1821H_GA0114242_100863 [Candidatus Kentron sp. MB]